MMPRIARWMGLVCVVLTAGCLSTPRLAPVDISGEGWTQRRGQAVWQFGRSAPEVVGELLVAVHRDGRQLVEFTKSVVTVARAQTDNAYWVLELPMYDRTLSGRGAPSDRFALFQLGRILGGEMLSENWEFSGTSDSWRLSNEKTGEVLEGFWEE